MCLNLHLSESKRNDSSGKNEYMQYEAYGNTLVHVCMCLSLFTCPYSPGREKAENEIKGKQLYWWSP